MEFLSIEVSDIFFLGGHGTRMEYIPIQDKDFETDNENDKFDFGTYN